MKRFEFCQLAVLFLSTALIPACSTDDEGRRQVEPVPEEPVTVFQENPDWTITYDGRQEYKDTYGYSDVDVISLKSIDNERYYLSIILKSNFESWYGSDVASFIGDEFSALGDIVSSYGSSYENETYIGNQSIYFDRMRSGNWIAVAFGVTSQGKLTGDYSMLQYRVDEETPSEGFNSWIGRWHVEGKSLDGEKNIGYDIQVSSSDANYLYLIKGWEDSDDYAFEAQYDRFYDEVMFKSVYMETYQADSQQYDFGFYGNFYYDGTMGYTDMDKGYYVLTDENIVIASALKSTETGNVEIQPYYLDFYHGTGDPYQTQFTSMQYFSLPVNSQDENVYAYSDDVPQFPLTMTRIENVSAGVKSAAEPSCILRLKASRHKSGIEPRRSSGSDARRSALKTE